MFWAWGRLVLWVLAGWMFRLWGGFYDGCVCTCCVEISKLK